MLSDEVLDKVVERLARRMEQANTYIIEQIGKSIKKIGTLSPSKAHELVQILKYGGDYDKIVKKLQEATKLNKKDIYKIFQEVAKKDYQFAENFYRYRNKKFIKWEENNLLKKQVDTLASQTAKQFENLTNTKAVAFGWVDKNGNVTFKGLKRTYFELLDEAVLNVSQGKETFDSALFRQLKEMGGGGIKVILPSTYVSKDGTLKNRVMRADSATRMYMKDALRQLNNEMQEEMGKEFDADMIEISVHGHPAPDHLMQGHQFLIKEFKKLQNGENAKDLQNNIYSLDHDSNGSFRPISTMNCYHTIFYGIAGVNKPLHSNEELQKIINENNEGFIFENKHYTLYEGEQLLRKIELELRKNKDMQIMGRTSDNKQLITEAQVKITQLTKKYNDILKSSGLHSSIQRARVTGYKRVNVANI